MRLYTFLAIGLFLMFNTFSAPARQKEPGQKEPVIPVGPASLEPDKARPGRERGDRGGDRNAGGNSKGGNSKEGRTNTVEVPVAGRPFKVSPKTKADYENLKSKPLRSKAQVDQALLEARLYKLDAFNRNNRGDQKFWNHVEKQILDRNFPLMNFFDAKNITLPPLPGDTYRRQPGFAHSLTSEDLRKLRQLRVVIGRRPHSASAYYLMLSDVVFDLDAGRMNGRDRLLINKALLCLPEKEKLSLERQWLRMSRTKDRMRLPDGRIGPRFTAPFWSEMHKSLRSLNLPFEETSDDPVLFDKAASDGCEPVRLNLRDDVLRPGIPKP